MTTRESTGHGRAPGSATTDRQPALQGPLIDIMPVAYLQRHTIIGRLFALLLLAISLPIIGILAILVRLGSRGPGLYTQVRVGEHGKIFVMYKIRSMVQDAELGTGPVWTHDEHDPRITLIGRFLRKSHLDELPQLFNVVRGEMALFGPRPERPELVHILAENIPGYFNRLAVRPGITGLAQINLPPDTDVESVRRKLRLDLEYIRCATVRLDLRMFVWTCLRLFGIPASVATRTMRLNRDVQPVPRNGSGPVSIDRILTAHRRASHPKNASPIRGLAIPGSPIRATEVSALGTLATSTGAKTKR